MARSDDSSYYRRIASCFPTVGPIALLDQEADHYEWLIRGMLVGARRVVGDPAKAPLLELLLDEVEALMDELVARASVTPDFLVGVREQYYVTTTV